MQNADCFMFNASDINLRNVLGVSIYRQTLCSLIEKTCDSVNDTGILSMDDITNTSHICILPAPIVQCPVKSFQCKDLSCIADSKQCNNIKDCSQGEDEQECRHRGCNVLGINCQTNCTWPQCRCGTEFFKCDSGGRVPTDTLCGFEQNCLDGSDEIHCNDLLSPAGQLPCADSRACVDEDKLFDGIEDCIDASDEYMDYRKACPGFQCNDQTCIPFTWLSDGIPDCPHDEDEQDFMLQRAIGNTEWPCSAGSLSCRGSVRKCYLREQHCIYETDSHGNIYTCRNARHLSACEDIECSNMYKCPMSYCIPFQRVCDGNIDCQDSSDESNCPMISCPGMFRCLKEQVCIHQEDVCDGKAHCKVSLDDEKYCHVKILHECSTCSDTDKSLRMSSLLAYSHVRTFSLQNTELTELVSSPMVTHTPLIVMDLSNNLIAALPSFAFHCFPYLQYIFLDHSLIHILMPSAFMNIGDLRVLDLSYNSISSLSTPHFQGLSSLSMMDISHNQIMAVDEIFFVEHLILSSLFVSDSIICCMMPPHTACVLEQSVSQTPCKDLFIHPTLAYILSVFTLAILVNNAFSIYISLTEKKNFLMLNLSLSDALFGFYLTVLVISDFHYRNRFSFYAKLWPLGASCHIAMLAFFVSFQQSLFSLIIISCRACILIAFPFKKHMFKHFNKALFGIWTVEMIQLIVVISLHYSGITIKSSHHFCQAPVVAPNIILPFVIPFGFCHVFFIFTFCVFLFLAIVLIKHKDKTLVTSSKQAYKRKMIRKSILASVVKFLSLSSVVIVECLLMAGFQIDEVCLTIVTITLMLLSKIGNPWIYTLQNWVYKKFKKV